MLIFRVVGICKRRLHPYQTLGTDPVEFTNSRSDLRVTATRRRNRTRNTAIGASSRHVPVAIRGLDRGTSVSNFRWPNCQMQSSRRGLNTASNLPKLHDLASILRSPWQATLVRATSDITVRKRRAKHGVIKTLAALAMHRVATIYNKGLARPVSGLASVTYHTTYNESSV